MALVFPEGTQNYPSNVLQCKVSKKTNTTSTSNGGLSEISSDFRVTLTPLASDSTIIVAAYLYISNNNNANTFRLGKNSQSDFSGSTSNVIERDGGNAANEDGVGSVYTNTPHMWLFPVVGWESAGSTDARTYSPFWRVGGGTMYLNRFTSDSYRGVSTMTVMEIAA